MRMQKWFRKTESDVLDDLLNPNKMVSAEATIWLPNTETFFMELSTMTARARQQLWPQGIFKPSVTVLHYQFQKKHRIASFSTTRNTKTKISQSRLLRCPKKSFHLIRPYKLKLFAECDEYGSRLHPSWPAFYFKPLRPTTRFLAISTDTW